MPPLPRSFQFSQASLQDFLDCQRRFDLRYRMALRWPAIEVEPIEEQEKRLVRGKAFHQLVQQHTVGLPAEILQRISLAPDMTPDLPNWWQNYLDYRPASRFGGESDRALVSSELTLEGFAAGYPLVVRYDMLVLVPGEQAVILDWKTSRKRTDERVLAGRMQTCLYRFLLVEGGHSLNGGHAIDPEQVEMIYWFPEFPDEPARFPYDSVQYAGDGEYLATVIGKIANMHEGDFEMTQDEKQCRPCMYRSYCDKGVRAPTLTDVAAAWDLQEQGAGLDLNFDRITEIEY